MFYCHNIEGGSEDERRSLESRYGKSLRLFPLPCGGRMDALHFLKALEEFADAAYLVTCPEGECRYSEGNTRAWKRASRTAELIQGIGLEKERVGVVAEVKEDPRTLSQIVSETMEKVKRLGPSPVFHGRNGRRQTARGRKQGSDLVVTRVTSAVSQCCLNNRLSN